MKTVLMTGFEPFAGDSINPSQEIATALHGRVIAGRRIASGILPCVFGQSVTELRRLLRATKPELVICLGLAGGRTEITPERVAINIDDARIPDNAGQQPVDVPIVASGPAAYWSTLPVKAIVAALRRKQIPAAVSQTAGTFVCNHIFYALMHELRRRRGVRGGFIHVPALQNLPVATMIEAIELAAKTALTTRRDVRVSGGRES
jgi:pyroglutamyl-peptidase